MVRPNDYIQFSDAPAATYAPPVNAYASVHDSAPSPDLDLAAEIEPATDDEVFITRFNFEDALAKKDMPVEVTRSAWVRFNALTGVQLDRRTGAVQQIIPEGLNVVRRMGRDHSTMLSLDGLVDGLEKGQFLNHNATRPTGIGPRRLAMVAILGHTYTPDRSGAIDAAVTTYNIPMNEVLTEYQTKRQDHEKYVASKIIFKRFS